MPGEDADFGRLPTTAECVEASNRKVALDRVMARTDLDRLRDAGDGDAVSVVSGVESGLCRSCDLFIGHGAAGVYEQPDWPEPSLSTRCWSCGRTQEQIDAGGPRYVFPGMVKLGDPDDHPVPEAAPEPAIRPPMGG